MSCIPLDGLAPGKYIIHNNEEYASAGVVMSVSSVNYKTGDISTACGEEWHFSNVYSVPSLGNEPLDGDNELVIILEESTYLSSYLKRFKFKVGNVIYFDVNDNEVEVEFSDGATCSIPVENVVKVLRISDNNNQNKKEINMNTVTNTLMTSNKANAIAVARVTAGKAINKKLIKLIKPRMPFGTQGIMDSEFAPLILANITAFAIKQYTDNDKAHKVADMMLEASAFQLAEGFNLDDMLEDLLDGISVPGMSNSSFNVSTASMAELRAYAKENMVDLKGITGIANIRQHINSELSGE